ncbi:MAG: tryptophan synthase subunit alpha [Dehalococcoidia bacterium]|jgi:tryptophan synthase alpha chain
MNRIDAFFARNRPIKRKALIAYLTVGYPNVDATIEIATALVEGGCDIIELGIPFSDPLADGATIQRASQRALESGITPQKCLEIAAKLRKKVDIPLLFMGYFNPMLHYGLDNFCAASHKAGIDGFIVPDLPPDEGSEAEAIMKNHGLDLVYLVAPTSSSQERLKFIADRAQGFIYVVSLKGVTGARSSMSTDLDGFISKVRKVTSKPLCVGFGISTPEQAQRAAGLADGVIIGSRILDIIEKSKHPAAEVKAFITEVRSAIDA